MLVPFIKAVPRAFKAAVCRTIDDVFFQNRMSHEEAKSILDLKAQFTKQDLDSKFQRFYMANATHNGGSPYIQQKIKNAFEVLR